MNMTTTDYADWIYRVLTENCERRPPWCKYFTSELCFTVHSPQCCERIYDRGTGKYSRCMFRAGHTCSHEDGCLSWDTFSPMVGRFVNEATSTVVPGVIYHEEPLPTPPLKKKRRGRVNCPPPPTSRCVESVMGGGSELATPLSRNSRSRLNPEKVVTSHVRV